MNSVYDNGDMILGCVKNIKTYLIEDAEETWVIENIIQDLKKFSNETIVSINLTLLPNYSIEYWNEDDFIKEYK